MINLFMIILFILLILARNDQGIGFLLTPFSKSQWNRRIGDDSTSKMLRIFVDRINSEENVSKSSFGIIPIQNSYYYWRLSDSFNSTTIKAILNLQEDIASFLTKIETSVLSFGRFVRAKVERDLRVTSSFTDILVSKIKQDLTDPSNLVNGAVESTLSPTLFNKDRSLLLNGLREKTTKERAQKIRKNKLVSLKVEEKIENVVDVYQAARVLPKKLEYQYKLQQLRKQRNAILSKEKDLLKKNYRFEELNIILQALSLPRTVSPTGSPIRTKDIFSLPTLVLGSDSLSPRKSTRSSIKALPNKSSINHLNDLKRSEEDTIIDVDGIGYSVSMNPLISEPTPATKVIETTAEIMETEEKKYSLIILSFLDVLFFVMETFLVSTITLITKEQGLLWERVRETYDLSTLSPFILEFRDTYASIWKRDSRLLKYFDQSSQNVRK